MHSPGVGGCEKPGVADAVDAATRMKREGDFTFDVGADFANLQPDYGITPLEPQFELPALPRTAPTTHALGVAEARRFLEALDADASAFAFQTFTDGTRPIKDPLARSWFQSLDAFKAIAPRFQVKGAGVFVQVNDGPRGKKNVTAPRALFIDDDVKDRKLNLTACPPSIVVESSPGKRQYFWLLVDDERTFTKLEEWQQAQRQLIAAHNTDPKMINYDRVMRLPGSLHMKNRAQPHRVCILDLHPDRRYTIAEVVAAYPATVKKQRRVVPQFIDRGELIELADELGLLTEQIHDDGGIHGTCPNADKHSDKARADCLYYPPDPEKGQTVGFVHCFHAHCEGIGPMAMLWLLKQKAPRLQTRPERWFAERSARMKLVYDPLHGLLVDGVAITVENFLRLLHIDAADVRIKPALADDIFGVWLDNQRKQALARFRSTLNFAPDDLASLKAWTYAVTGQADPTDVAVVAHFIWQVKRKLHGMPVERHMMPIFVGAQDGGKSTAVRKLIEPIRLAGLLENCSDLRLVEDDRHVARFATKLIVFCDEMTKASKTDVAALKGFITKDDASWRLMRSTQTSTVVNLATFIGTANPDVIDLINDPTGMRRFYEMRCKAVLDWQTINTIDYLRLWRSVDHHAPPPVSAVWGDINIRQKKITNQNSIEEWLGLHAEFGEDVRQWAEAGEVYSAYADWMKMQRRFPETVNAFGRTLTRLNVDRSRSNGLWYRLVLHSGLIFNVKFDN